MWHMIQFKTSPDWFDSNTLVFILGGEVSEFCFRIQDSCTSCSTYEFIRPQLGRTQSAVLSNRAHDAPGSKTCVARCPNVYSIGSFCFWIDPILSHGLAPASQINPWISTTPPDCDQNHVGCTFHVLDPVPALPAPNLPSTSNTYDRIGRIGARQGTFLFEFAYLNAARPLGHPKMASKATTFLHPTFQSFSKSSFFSSRLLSNGCSFLKNIYTHWNQPTRPSQKGNQSSNHAFSGGYFGFSVSSYLQPLTQPGENKPEALT